MKSIAFGMVLLAVAAAPLGAQDWTKELKDPAKRASLHDAAQLVRGDSGKWNDDAQLLHAPPIAQKPAKTSLDSWADSLVKKKPELTGKDENWLIYRTEQLDDNDRVWIERVERRGKQINVVAKRAKWQGKYFRNFTYYAVIGLNLGKLEAGKYDVKMTIEPVVFSKFDGDGKALDTNWPKDERRADKKASELKVTFNVLEASP